MKIIINVNSINEIEPKLKKLSSLNENYPVLTAGMEVEFIVGSTYNDGKTMEECTHDETKQEKYVAKSFPFGIPKQVVDDDGNSFKILRKKSPFKIERLSPELKDKVDFMLFSQSATYQNIVDYLQSEGITISTMSVSRYVRSVLLNDL